jgi:hypothetical protein
VRVTSEREAPSGIWIIRTPWPARGGNAEAQEILGVMEAFGPTIFPGIAGDLAESWCWLGLDSLSGRPAARYL